MLKIRLTELVDVEAVLAGGQPFDLSRDLDVLALDLLAFYNA